MRNENVNEPQNQQSCQNAVSGSTYKQRPIWTVYYLSYFKWYRKYRKLKWYKHQFTEDALELSITFTGTFWALYSNINRYSEVVETEML